MQPQVSQDEAISSEPVSMPSSSSPDLRLWKKFGDSEEHLVTAAPSDEPVRPLQHIPLQVVDPVSIDHLPDGTEVLRKQSERLDEVKDNGRRIKTIILRTFHKTICTETVTTYEVILPRKSEQLVGTTLEEHITDMAPGLDETMTEGIKKTHSRQDFEKEILPDGTWLKRSVSLTVIDPAEPTTSDISPREGRAPVTDSVPIPADTEKPVDEVEAAPNGTKARKVIRTVVSRIDTTTKVEETSITKPGQEPLTIAADEVPVQPSSVDGEGDLVSSSASSDSGFEMITRDSVSEQPSPVTAVKDTSDETSQSQPTAVKEDAAMLTSKVADEVHSLLLDATEDDQKGRDPEELQESQAEVADTEITSPVSDELSFVFVGKEADLSPEGEITCQAPDDIPSDVKPAAVVDEQRNLDKEKMPQKYAEVRFQDAQKPEDQLVASQQAIVDDITNLDRLLQPDKPDLHHEEPEIVSPESVDGSRGLDNTIGVLQETEPDDMLQKPTEGGSDEATECTPAEQGYSELAKDEEIVSSVMKLDEMVLSSVPALEDSFQLVAGKEDYPVAERVDVASKAEVAEPKIDAPAEISVAFQHYDGTRALEDVVGVLEKEEGASPKTEKFPSVVEYEGLVPQEEGAHADYGPTEVVKQDVEERTPEAKDDTTDNVVVNAMMYDQFVVLDERHDDRVDVAPCERLDQIPAVEPEPENAFDIHYATKTDELLETPVSVEYYDGTRKLEDVIGVMQSEEVPHVDVLTPKKEVDAPGVDVDKETTSHLRVQEPATDEIEQRKDANEIVENVSVFEQTVLPDAGVHVLPDVKPGIAEVSVVEDADKKETVVGEPFVEIDATMIDDLREPSGNEMKESERNKDIDKVIEHVVAFEKQVFPDNGSSQLLTGAEQAPVEVFDDDGVKIKDVLSYPFLLQQTEITTIAVDEACLPELVLGSVQQPGPTEIQATVVTPQVDGLLADDNLHGQEMGAAPQEILTLDMAETLDKVLSKTSPELAGVPDTDTATEQQIVEDLTAFEQLVLPGDPPEEGHIGFAPVDDGHVPRELETTVSFEYYDGTRTLEEVVGAVEKPETTQPEMEVQHADGLIPDDDISATDVERVEVRKDSDIDIVTKAVDETIAYPDQQTFVVLEYDEAQTFEDVVKVVVQENVTDTRPVDQTYEIHRPSEEEIFQDIASFSESFSADKFPLPGVDQIEVEDNWVEVDVQPPERAVEVQYHDGTRSLEDVFGSEHDEKYADIDKRPLTEAVLIQDGPQQHETLRSDSVPTPLQLLNHETDQPMFSTTVVELSLPAPAKQPEIIKKEADFSDSIPRHTTSITVQSIDISVVDDKPQILTYDTPTPVISDVLDATQPQMVMTTAEVEDSCETAHSAHAEVTLPEVVVVLPEPTLEVGVVASAVPVSDEQKPVKVEAALTEMAIPPSGEVVVVGAAGTELAFDSQKEGDFEAALTEKDVPSLGLTYTNRAVPVEEATLELKRVVDVADTDTVVRVPEAFVAVEDSEAYSAMIEQPIISISQPIEAQISSEFTDKQAPFEYAEVADTPLVMESMESTPRLVRHQKADVDVELSTPQTSVTLAETPRGDFLPEEIPVTGPPIKYEEPVSLEVDVDTDLVSEVVCAVEPDAVALKESPLVGGEITAIERLPREIHMAADDVIDDKTQEEIMILADRICDDAVKETMEDLQRNLPHAQLKKATDIADDQTALQQPTLTISRDLTTTINEPVDIQVDSNEIISSIAELDQLVQLPESMKLPQSANYGKNELIVTEIAVKLPSVPDETYVAVEFFDGTRKLKDVLAEQEKLPSADSMPDHTETIDRTSVRDETYIDDIPTTDIAFSEKYTLVSTVSVPSLTDVTKPENTETDEKSLQECDARMPQIFDSNTHAIVKLSEASLVCVAKPLGEESESPQLSADSEFHAAQIGEFQIDEEADIYHAAGMTPSLAISAAENASCTEISNAPIELSKYMLKQHDITPVDSLESVSQPDQPLTADLGDDEVHMTLPQQKVLEKEDQTAQVPLEQAIVKEKRSSHKLIKQFTMETCEFELYQEPSEIVVQDELSSGFELVHSAAVSDLELDFTVIEKTDIRTVNIEAMPPTDHSRDISVLYSSIETTFEPSVPINQFEIENVPVIEHVPVLDDKSILEEHVQLNVELVNLVAELEEPDTVSVDDKEVNIPPDVAELQEETRGEKSFASSVITEQFITETQEVDVHGNIHDVAITKELSPEMKAVDIVEMTTADIEDTVPTAEAEDTHVLESTPVAVHFYGESIEAPDTAVLDKEEFMDLEMTQTKLDGPVTKKTHTTRELVKQYTMESCEFELYHEPIELVPEENILGDVQLAQTAAVTTIDIQHSMPVLKAAEVDGKELNILHDVSELQVQIVGDNTLPPSAQTEQFTADTDKYEVHGDTCVAITKELSPEVEAVSAVQLSTTDIEATLLVTENEDKQVIERTPQAVQNKPESAPVSDIAIRNKEEFMNLQTSFVAKDEPRMKPMRITRTLVKQYTMESCEFELHHEPIQIVAEGDISGQLEQANTAIVSTSTTELNMPLETAIQQLTVQNSGEEEEKEIVEVISPAAIAAEQKAPEETKLAAEEQPVSEVETTEIITEKSSSELRPEISEAYAVKEESPKLALVDTAAITDVPIEASLSSVDGKHVQAVESLEITEPEPIVMPTVAFEESEEKLIDLQPRSEEVFEQPEVEAEVVSETVATPIKRKTYEAARPEEEENEVVEVISPAVIAVEQKAPEEKQPVSEVETAEIITETSCLEIRPEISEAYAVKEESPELALVDTAAITDVHIEASLSSVDARDIQAVESLEITVPVPIVTVSYTHLTLPTIYSV